MTLERQRAASEDVEAVIARLLYAGTVTGVALLAVGVVLMAVNGVSPESATFPAFDPATVVADLVAMRPEGWLWAGIVVLIATPIARVIGELITFAVRGDRLMAGVALAILGVIALSVAVALVVEG
ncbi:MAG TPA: DUF1634 domain-containing protein [Candidatus Limnocylindrales bacterium]|nr:DUF1634 domain-containing protein [Candidatus Limnocylindrales bacterium]